jgi:hypothetical protein
MLEHLAMATGRQRAHQFTSQPNEEPPVILYVLAVSVVNLALGSAVAMFWLRTGGK